MPKSKNKLVIIESPGKARTLLSYLGPEFEVIASVGHVRDLPRNRIGVSEANGFKPTYTVLPEQRKTVARLKKTASRFKKIYLAADPDREGEAICWHLSQLLAGEDRIFRRLRFNAVTRKAVLDAVKHPSRLDMDLVDAQQARRVMDRLVGYRVSPYLWRTIGKGLSAGRVQTVALRLIREREDHIESFVPREYWPVTADFSVGGAIFRGNLTRVDGAPANGEKHSPADRGEVDRLLPRIRKADWTLSSVETKVLKRKPGPPFITSTLQAAASLRLSMTPSRTMRCAQQLYEGLPAAGEASTGLITYMRTDSVRISSTAISDCRKYIAAKWGDGATVKKARRFRSSGGAQDAHEAIRPVDPSLTPDSLKSALSKDQHRLYDLIWKRFVATQMRDAEIERTVLLFHGDGLEFRCSGELLAKEGFTVVDPSQFRKEAILPSRPSRGRAECIDVQAEQKFTSPLPRFTEAGLVSEMKKQGIGRPSTYVSIISTLRKRKYIESRERKLHPTELGSTVVRLLIELFPHIFEIGFTADMEKLLDSIAKGEMGYTEALEQLSLPLTSSLELALTRLSEVRDNLSEKCDENCPKCGRSLVIKWGQYGKFYACTGFPDCRYTGPVEAPDNSLFADRACPVCGGSLVLRNGRYGTYLSCMNSPDCKHSESVPTGVSCPVEGCSGELVERRSRKGRQFFSCNRYPHCDYALWNRPANRICPKCGFPILEKRVKGIYCPRCRKKIEEP
jgi:DNA topoisomerase-1